MGGGGRRCRGIFPANRESNKAGSQGPEMGSSAEGRCLTD